MKKINLILAALLIYGGIQAQNFGSIHGTVVSQDTNEPVFSAVVSASNGVHTANTITDDEGKFKINALESGSYTLKIQSVEYANIEIKDVIVNPNEANVLGKLEMGSNLLGPITIIRHTNLIKKDNPALIPILAKDIKKNALAKNINGLVSQIPGVTGGGPDGQELYFRGSRPQSINTYVDGVKLISPNLTNIPSNAIKSISVYTGGVPAAYGDVTGGVIILETKSYMDFYNERFN